MPASLTLAFGAIIKSLEGFLYGSACKESAYNVGDLGSIPGLRRSPGEGDSYPLQYSGLENSMDCIVHGVTKSQTRLSAFHFSFSKSLEHEHRDATTGNLITQGATKGQTANSEHVWAGPSGIRRDFIKLITTACNLRLIGFYFSMFGSRSTPGNR